MVTTEIPRMTNVTNGFALAMENIKRKFTDFKENAIIPVTEELKKQVILVCNLHNVLGKP